jgi:hypothetical protein
MALSIPLVNGFRYGWASIAVQNGPDKMPGLRGVSFKCAQELGESRGAGVQKLGDIRGPVTFEASITLLLEDQFDFCTALGEFYMSTPFGLLVKYEEGTTINRVELVGCKIKEEDHTHAPGAEGLEVTMPLAISYYLKNGLLPVAGLVK